MERNEIVKQITEYVKNSLGNRTELYLHSYDFIKKLTGCEEDNYTNRQLGSMIGEAVREVENCSYKNLKVYRPRLIKSIKKEKNLLYVYTTIEDFIYDFNTEKWNKYIPHIYTLFGLNPYSYCSWENFTICEWALSYPELLGGESDIEHIRYLSVYGKNLPKECPKGYINWLKENNLLISTVNVNIYNRTRCLNQIAPNLENNIFGEFIKRDFVNYNMAENTLTFYNKFSNQINKIIKNSDTLEFLYKELFFKTVELIENMNKVEIPFDTNRGYAENERNYLNLKETQEKKTIAKRLQKLNFLTEIEDSNYTIVVPQGLEDLQEEGRRQNNCVGYYYNEHIMKGDDLIYFIRKKDNPTKNYVTVRYNISSQNSPEIKIANNYNPTSEIYEFVDKVVDPYINKHLNN